MKTTTTTKKKKQTKKQHSQVQKVQIFLGQRRTKQVSKQNSHFI